MALIGPGYVKPSPFAKLGQTAPPAFPTYAGAPAPAPPPPPGSPYDYGANNYGPNGPAYTPPPVDYNALIQSMLAPLQQEAAGMTKADKAALLAQQQRAYIQFGEQIPGGVGVNQATQQAAAKNTAAGLSITARVNQAHLDAVRQLKNTLAARGLLRSGETGFQTGREQTGYTQAQYDARQKTLDYLSGIQQAYNQAQQQRQWALAQAAMSAAQSVPQYPTAPPPYAGGGYDYGANNYGPNGPAQPAPQPAPQGPVSPTSGVPLTWG